MNPKNFLRNAKQEFPWQSLESFSGEYYNMDLCVPTKLAQISVGSEQDEAEIQCDRWSTPEW